jgi:signal transduction histidine kinase/HAMP domain-containing protein
MVNHQMSVSNDPPNHSLVKRIAVKQWWSSAWIFLRSIRARIVLPYAVLTVLVAFAGTYIVTTLVQGSLEERLQRELMESALVAGEEVSNFQNRQLSKVRELTYLQGAYEDMRDGDHQALQDLLLPSVSNSAIRRAIITDLAGNVVLDIVLPPGKAEPETDGPLTGRSLSMVPSIQRVLDGLEDEYGDRHADLVEIEGVLYLAISGPFRVSTDPDEEGSELLGVVMVAEPLQSLLNQIKEVSVARRVTVYADDGHVLATTLSVDEPQREEELTISPAFFQAVTSNPTRTPQQERTVLGHQYRFAYFVFWVLDRPLGVMSIGLESSFVPQTGTWGRFQFTVIFSLAMVAVIGIGYIVSRRIIIPIMQLVRTSRAVAQGDLTQRTRIKSNDEIGRLAATFDQMTESLAQRTKELERLLREKRQEASRIQAILDSITDGVLMEEQADQIAVLNPAAQELLALLSEQFNAMKPVRVLEETEDTRRFEIGDRVISTQTSPVLMPDGKQLGKVTVIRDVTRETEVDRLKDEFISQISHELRTPLTNIKGYGDLLKAMGDSLDFQQLRFVETIHHHTEHLEEMIAQLLDFTQLEAGNLGLRFEPMSLESVVRHVAESWVERFKEKEIKFFVHVDGVVPEMMGDERRLRWALTNLVENAFNYTPEGGEVTLSLVADQDSITVQVADTGVGIAPEDQVHLFTRFYRVSLERTVDVRGSGVGLYVAKAIVEGHGGEIGVESELGEGSTFAINLPLDAGARDQKPPKEGFTDLGDLLQ